MKTQNKTSLFIALALIGATSLALGSTVELSRMTRATLDPNSGSGDTLLIQEEQEASTEDLFPEEAIPLDDEEHNNENSSEVLEVEDLPTITEEEPTTEEETTEVASEEDMEISENTTETTSTSTGSILELLQELYGSSQTISEQLGIISAPQGNQYDQQQNMAEYVFRQAVSEAYKQTLQQEIEERIRYQTQTIDYANLSDELQNSPWIRREDQERLQARRSNATVIHRTTGSGSFVELEAENFLLPPYTQVSESDIPHVALRALSEVRTLLEIPADQVSVYMNQESAELNTNGISLAQTSQTLLNDTWSVRYQLYYHGKVVQGAEVQLRILTSGKFTYARSILPSFSHFIEPAEKQVYFDTITQRISDIFPQFDPTKDQIEEVSDLYLLEQGSIIPVIRLRVRTHNPLGLWTVVVNGTNGQFIKKYNHYYFGEEMDGEQEDRKQGVPHQAWIMYLANSVQDAPAYTVQTKQWIRLSSMVAQFATEQDGIFYPEHATTTLELSGPHVRVHKGTSTYTSRITRNYLEFAESLYEETETPETASGSGGTIYSGSGSSIGSGTTLIGDLWSSVEGLDTGLVHPLYWSAEEASLAEMNVYTHITNYEEYVRTILGYTGTPKEQIAIVDSALLNTAFKSCGAFYDSISKEIHFGAGGCGEHPYSYSRDMIIHEYAHALLDTLYTPVYRDYSFEDALLEGVADYLTASFTNDPIIGEYTLTQPRTLEYPQAVVTYDQYGNIEEVFWSHNTYENAAIVGSILWDLRKELGAVVTDKIVLEAMALHPRSLEELRVALLRADDDDSVLANGTPNEQHILQIFARRGIIDRYQESDIALYTDLGLVPLAPQEIVFTVENHSGPYAQLQAQEGMTFSARFVDHREYVQASQIEIHTAGTSQFTNPSIETVSIEPISSGSTTEGVIVPYTENNTYMRLRFIDQDGRKGAWSETFYLTKNERQLFSIHELPDRDLSMLENTKESRSISNSDHMSVLTGTGVHIISGNDVSYLGSHILGSDVEQPYKHLANDKYIVVYDENFENTLVIERSTAQRYLFTSGDVFVKEDELWKRAAQKDTLPSGMTDIQLVTYEEKDYLLLTTTGSIQSYDLAEGKRLQTYISTHATLIQSIAKDGTIYTYAKSVDDNQERLYVLENALGKEAQAMSYFLCNQNCDAPEDFQQLPNSTDNEQVKLFATPNGIVFMNSQEIVFVQDPYTEGTAVTYTITPEEGKIHIPTIGETILDSAVEGNLLHILTEKEVITWDTQENHARSYVLLESSQGRSLTTLANGMLYIDAIPHALLYSKEIPALEEVTSEEDNQQTEQNDDTNTETPSPEENESEGGVSAPEEDGNTEEDMEEQTDEEEVTTEETGVSVSTTEEEKRALELGIEEGIKLEVNKEEERVHLQWEVENNEKVHAYHLYRANNTNVYSGSPRIAEITREQTTYVDSPEQERGLYRYVIYALDEEASIISRSNIVEVQTSSVPVAPSFVLPQQNAVVFNKPVLQFASSYVATTDSTYQIQLASDNEFKEILIDYTSGNVHREEYGFKLGQTAGSGVYHTGSDIKSLQPGIYFARARVIAPGNIEGSWSETRQMIVDDLQVSLNNTQAISFDTAGRGESIISSGTTVISAETYVPSFSFKVFTDTPLLLAGQTNKEIKSWDGEQGFGFAFRWSADNGQTWNYRRGDSEIEWTRIPENLSYYPIGTRTSPTSITLHSELQHLEKKQFLVELMFRVKTAEGDVGQYTTNVTVAPSKDMYGIFGQ